LQIVINGQDSNYEGQFVYIFREEILVMISFLVGLSRHSLVHLIYSSYNIFILGRIGKKINLYDSNELIGPLYTTSTCNLPRI